MKVGGQILWNVTPICETSQIYYLMGRRLVKDVFGQPFYGPIIPFGSLVEYHLRTAKDHSIIHQFGKKVLPGLFLGYALYAGRHLEGWRTDRRPWGVGNDGRIRNLLKKTQCERWYFPKKKENLFFQSQMDEWKPLEEIRNWEHPPWYGIDQFKEKVILENQKGLFHNFKTHFRMPAKLWLIFFFGPRQETSKTAITLNQESNITRRERNYSLFHWKYMDVFRTTHTNLDVKQEKRIDDYWNIDGSRDLSDLWTGFTQFTLLDEKVPDGHMWSGERWTRKQLTFQTRSLMARNLGENGKQCQAQGEAKVVQWKSFILKTHENCEGFISLTLRTRNSKKPSRTLVRSWKHQWLLLCPAKLWKRIEGVVDPTKLKQNVRVFWKLMNPQECVWQIRCRSIIKTILQEKERVHNSTTIWIHKFILMPQAIKIPAAKAAVDKEWEKLDKISTWNLTKVRSKKEVIDEALCRALQFILHH